MTQPSHFDGIKDLFVEWASGKSIAELKEEASDKEDPIRAQAAVGMLSEFLMEGEYRRAEPMLKYEDMPENKTTAWHIVQCSYAISKFTEGVRFRPIAMEILTDENISVERFRDFCEWWKQHIPWNIERSRHILEHHGKYEVECYLKPITEKAMEGYKDELKDRGRPIPDGLSVNHWCYVALQYINQYRDVAVRWEDPLQAESSSSSND
ncbi:hypothetical protein NA57DRAFT_73413 [Rhizodiscina lignyota]|uniref:Uncharacterized protein n=1 Tax=Rhizodiscina lignyota TaxID=1504668 RepID=A0A9P4IM74_9PEZI|nr:hypothetical protein NA57DRAFT_73413 [Rhizodiscina lignyota]